MVCLMKCEFGGIIVLEMFVWVGLNSLVSWCMCGDSLYSWLLVNCVSCLCGLSMLSIELI